MHTLPLPQIHQRPLLTWVATTAVLLGLIAAALFVAGANIQDRGTNYYVPEGYRRNATEVTPSHSKSAPRTFFIVHHSPLLRPAPSGPLSPLSGTQSEPSPNSPQTAQSPLDALLLFAHNSPLLRSED